MQEEGDLLLNEYNAGPDHYTFPGTMAISLVQLTSGLLMTGYLACCTQAGRYYLIENKYK